MGYKVEIKRRSTMTTSEWSGGTTTQLMIFPDDSDYKRRDFIFRLSSARVELEESEFTPLPGVDRIIMILQGKLKIIHQNHYEKLLNPYEMDTFSGDWTTKSKGKVTDFNLMTRDGAKAELEAVCICIDESVERNLGWTSNDCMSRNETGSKRTSSDAIKSKRTSYFVFCPEDSICIEQGENKYILEPGDLMHIYGQELKETILLKHENKKNVMVLFGVINY